MKKKINFNLTETNRYARALLRLIPQTKRAILGPHELIIIGSAHKVGSTWLYKLLKETCTLRKYSIPSDITDQFPDKLKVDIGLDAILSANKRPRGIQILKTHSSPPGAHEIPPWLKIVTIKRDPRDVIISASFYLSQLPESQGGWDDDFKGTNEQGRIVRLINEGTFLREKLTQWHNFEHAYELSYEALLKDPVGELQNLLEVLEISVDVQKISSICDKLSFRKQIGRKRRDEIGGKFLRKGISGDWKNYFDEDVKLAFKQSHNGAWNKLLIDLGYEETMDW